MWGGWADLDIGKIVGVWEHVLGLVVALLLDYLITVVLILSNTPNKPNKFTIILFQSLNYVQIYPYYTKIPQKFDPIKPTLNIQLQSSQSQTNTNHSSK